MQHANRLCPRKQSCPRQKRCILDRLSDGNICSCSWPVSSSVSQNASSNEVLLARRTQVDSTVKSLKTHLFLHSYYPQVLSTLYLNKRTPKPHQKHRSVIQWIRIISVSEKSVITVWARWAVSHTYLNPSQKSCKLNSALSVLYAQTDQGKTIRKKLVFLNFKYYVLYYVNIQNVYWNP